MTQIVGILNVTRDSFSDGGRYLAPDAAVAHAWQMAADGADLIDVGAESTHPDAESVSADEEIARLTPVVTRLTAGGVRVSVDTYKPAVMRHVLGLGVEFINDVTALRDPEAVAAVRDADVRIVLMHSMARGPHAEAGAQAPAPSAGTSAHQKRGLAPAPRNVVPERGDVAVAGLVERIVAFFERRVRELEAARITRSRLILDPGMGLFLGSNPAASLAVLRDLPRLAQVGLPLMVSTSRKSFVGVLLGEPGSPRPVNGRAAGTLATELWAAQHRVAYIRTHDVRALHDALTVWHAVEGAGP